MSEIFEKIITPPALIVSAGLTMSISFISLLADNSLFGVSMNFVLIVCIFMVVDWFLGVYSSVAVSGKKFQSKKLTYTIIKFLTLFMWLYFINKARQEYNSSKWAADFIEVIQIFVLILINLREFVSIGENIEKIFGTKPYLFALIDTIFITMEKLFKKKLENKLEDENENYIPDDDSAPIDDELQNQN